MAAFTTYYMFILQCQLSTVKDLVYSSKFLRAIKLLEPYMVITSSSGPIHGRSSELNSVHLPQFYGAILKYELASKTPFHVRLSIEPQFCAVYFTKHFKGMVTPLANQSGSSTIMHLDAQIPFVQFLHHSKFCDQSKI